MQYQMGAESLAARTGQPVYQAAELLRLACCLATERGVEVCAPVHDALLIEAPLAELPEQVRRTQAAMEETSVAVLDGFRLRSDTKLTVAPERYEDEKGAAMWKLVWEVVGEMEAASAA